MLTRIRKWGNSLCVRIPKSIAYDARLREDVTVNLKVVNGRLMVLPVKQKTYDLKALLKKVTPDNLHAEIEHGPRAGKEIR